MFAYNWPFPVSATLGNGRQCYVDLRSGVGRHIYMTGKFDPQIFMPFKKILKPGGVFCDIGANVGYYSMLALDHVGKSGSIYAFEVDPRPIKCLKKTIRRNNLTNIHLLECALGDKKGHATLNQVKDCGHTRVVINSVGKGFPVDTLDNYAKGFKGEIQGIKIDVEGFELMVLRGAEKTIRKHKPVIVFESDSEHANHYGYSLKDIRSFFAELDYQISDIEGAWDKAMLARPRRSGKEYK